MVEEGDPSPTSGCCAPRRTEGSIQHESGIAKISAATETIRNLNFVAIGGGRTHVGVAKADIPQDGESPKRDVRLKPYRIATSTVTNDQFRDFIRETGYVTQAEKIGNAAVFRGLLPDRNIEAPSNPAFSWWVIIDGACWHAPEGPGSDLQERGDHPVVQVSHADALAYCAWSGTRLPSEAEWEHAARGGLPAPRFPWGDDEPTDDTVLCNIWQGEFPHYNTEKDGYYGTAPGVAFQPNGYGLYNMAGNVWEWTSDPFRIRSLNREAKARNDIAKSENEFVLKGGSFLCHISYCYRYRIAARHALEASSATSNVGLRVAI